MTKTCKNCRWLVKIREEYLNQNMHFCLRDQSRTTLMNEGCPNFEDCVGVIKHIPIICLNFFGYYERVLDTETKEMEQELGSYERTINKIREAVGIKISNIENEVNKIDGKKNEIEKLIRSRDWYKNHYGDLKDCHNGLCNAVGQLGYTIINDGKKGIEKK